MPACFVIMPISTPEHLVAGYGGDPEHFKHVLDHLFEPALDKAGFELIPPSFEGSDLIPAGIVRRLVESDLVLCDISSLNPNVFLELGIRTALNKPVALVKDGLVDKIPFDTGGLGHLTYDQCLAAWTLEHEIARLTQHLQANSDTENAMWKYYGMRLQADSPPGESAVEEQFDYIMRKLDILERSSQVDEVKADLAARERSKTLADYLRHIAAANAPIPSPTSPRPAIDWQAIRDEMNRSMKKCPNCGLFNPSQRTKCSSCETLLE